MFRNIREPGGVIGAFAVGSTVLLLLSGLFSVAVIAKNSQDFGAGERTIWGVVGVANWLGCVGFALGRKHALPGMVVAAIGALAFSAFYFWALLPLLLGPAIALLAVLRAQRFTRGTAV
ncbi:MAG: hypothetical protein HY875_02290 [Chloroflexi bacterium]|nr:hypothetical protein [Chloroflexota bacterium]